MDSYCIAVHSACVSLHSSLPAARLSFFVAVGGCDGEDCTLSLLSKNFQGWFSSSTSSTYYLVDVLETTFCFLGLQYSDLQTCFDLQFLRFEEYSGLIANVWSPYLKAILILNKYLVSYVARRNRTMCP